MKTNQTALLAELREEVRAYLETDKDVEAWINAPLSDLGGSSPTDWLRDHGAAGLRQLIYRMVDWMPRTPDEEFQHFDETEAMAALEKAAESDEGAREMHRLLKNP